MNRTETRMGAGAAMLGAAIALVFNLLHPHSADITSAAATADLARQGGIWRFDHYMLGWTGLLLLVALPVIARSMTSEPAQSWARIALPFAIASTAIFLTWAAMDGFALPEATTADPLVAESVAHVVRGLFVAMLIGLFGATPILFGVSILVGDDYPGWLGIVAVLAGTVGLVAATMIFLGGFTSLAYDVLFTSGSILFTAWIGVTGIVLWRSTRSAVGSRALTRTG